jgi:hypothetical protein
LPTANQLRVAGIPLAVFGIFLTIATIAVSFGIRRAKTLRETE